MTVPFLAYFFIIIVSFIAGGMRRIMWLFLSQLIVYHKNIINHIVDHYKVYFLFF